MPPPMEMPALPKWLRATLVAGLIVIAAGVGFGVYRWMSQPVTLTVAAGSIDGDAVRLISAIAKRLAETNSPIRLKIVDKGTAIGTAEAFAKREVNAAIVRGDVGDLSAARTVVLLTHGVALLMVPPGSSLEDMDDIKGKTIGVIGLEVNRSVVSALDEAYDLTRSKTQFKGLMPPEVGPALRLKQVQALLAVVPLTEKYLTLLRDVFPRSGKHTVKLIAIDAAGAIAATHGAYESFDVPKGTIRGSPAIPDDDLTTVRVPFYLVANAKVPEDQVTALAKAVMDTRRDLIPEFPLLAQIAAPSTDKDAQIQVHPGAKTYFDGDEKSFFDKYGDMLFYGSMMLGALTSLLAGAWKFVASDGKADEPPLPPLYDVLAKVRAASDEAELSDMEDRIDGILKRELEKHASKSETALDAAALSLAAHRIEHAINQRRIALRAGTASPSAQDRPPAPTATPDPRAEAAANAKAGAAI